MSCQAYEDGSPFDTYLAITLAVGIILSYVPQQVSIIKRRTIEGISPLFLMLMNIGSALVLGNMLIESSPLLRVCELSAGAYPGRCGVPGPAGHPGAQLAVHGLRFLRVQRTNDGWPDGGGGRLCPAGGGGAVVALEPQPHGVERPGAVRGRARGHSVPAAAPDHVPAQAHGLAQQDDAADPDPRGVPVVLQPLRAGGLGVVDLDHDFCSGDPAERAADPGDVLLVRQHPARNCGDFKAREPSPVAGLAGAIRVPEPDVAAVSAAPAAVAAGLSLFIIYCIILNIYSSNPSDSSPSVNANLVLWGSWASLGDIGDDEFEIAALDDVASNICFVVSVAVSTMKVDPLYEVKVSVIAAASSYSTDASPSPLWNEIACWRKLLYASRAVLSCPELKVRAAAIAAVWYEFRSAKRDEVSEGTSTVVWDCAVARGRSANERMVATT